MTGEDLRQIRRRDADLERQVLLMALRPPEIRAHLISCFGCHAANLSESLRTCQQKVEANVHYSLSRAESTICDSLPSDSLMAKTRDVFRARLLALLQDRHMSAADLARSVGKTDAWVSALLSGKRGTTMETFDQLAGALGVPVSDLFTLVALEQQRPDTSVVVSGAPIHKDGAPHAVALAGTDRATSPRTLDERVDALEVQFAEFRRATLRADLDDRYAQKQRRRPSAAPAKPADAQRRENHADLADREQRKRDSHKARKPPRRGPHRGGGGR